MNKKVLLALLIAILLAAGGGYYYYKSRVKADAVGDTNLARGTIVTLMSGTNQVKRQLPLTLTFTFSVKGSRRTCTNTWTNICRTQSLYEDQTQTKVVTTDANGQFRVSANSYKKLTALQINEVLMSFIADSAKRELTAEEKTFTKQLSDELNTLTAEQAKTATADSLFVTPNDAPNWTRNSRTTFGDITKSIAVANSITIPPNSTLKSISVAANSDTYQSEPLVLAWDSIGFKTEAQLAISLKSGVAKNMDEATTKFVAALSVLDSSSTARNDYETLFTAFNNYLKTGAISGYDNALTQDDIKTAMQTYLKSRNVLFNLVKNGSFEDGTTGWAIRHVGDGATEQIITGTAAATCSNGNKCLKLTSNKGTYQGASQTFANLEQGQKYRFSADYRTEGKGTLGEININDASLNKQYPIFAQGDSTWKRVSVEIPAVASSVIEVILYGDNGGSGSGTVYWDNAVFEKVQ